MKLALSLSGGGVRGAAQIGALKVFEENNIKVDIVTGTSAGSIIATLYAMGYTADEMIKLFKYFAKETMGIGPYNIYAGMKEVKGINLGGLTSSINIEKAMSELGKLKGISNINEIKMPIAIPATDLIRDREIVFTNNLSAEGDYYIKDIPIGKAVRASCTFPGMYSPVEYKEYQFVDGGVFDNLPSEEAKYLGADKIIAIKFKMQTTKKQKSVYNIAMHSLDLMTENLIKDSVKLCDYVLDVDLKGVKPFNIKKIDFCYEQGYRQTLEQIEKIKNVIGNVN